jgi:GNAT superfamily N-acetyltransferase
MTGANVTIRPLEAGDEADWRRLWTLYLEYYEASLPEAVYQHTWRRLLAGNAIHGLIARHGEQAVGLTHYLFHPTTWSEADMCYLEDLVVDPEWRGQHIGRALIKAVYDAADAAHCPEVYWLTQHFNAAGRRLYDRVGTLTPFIRYDRPG